MLMTGTANAAELKSRSLVGVIGPDWRDFLQGLLSQDVETLEAGSLRFGALLTPQGKLLFDLFILGRDDGCWLDVAADRRDALIQRLTIYKLRAKVEIAAVEAPVWALWGGDAPGWPADPRLPALGWRGYGAPPPARDHRRGGLRRHAAGARRARPGQGLPAGDRLSDRGQFRPFERHRFPEGLFRRPGDHLAHEAPRCDQDPHAAHRLRRPARRPSAPRCWREACAPARCTPAARAAPWRCCGWTGSRARA